MSGDRLFKVVLVVVLLAWLVVTGLLIRQNMQLKEQVAALQPALSLAPGEKVAPLDLMSLGGTPSTIGFRDVDETLLLVFSPGCPACGENFPRWDRVTSATAGGRQVVYLSTDSPERTRPYVEERGLAEPVYVADRGTLNRLKIARIPTTLRIGRDGVVTGSWVGVLPDDAVSELSAVR